jgi:hypothetical protein
MRMPFRIYKKENKIENIIKEKLLTTNKKLRNFKTLR